MANRMAKTQKKIMVFVLLMLIFILVLTGLSGHYQMLQRSTEPNGSPKNEDAQVNALAAEVHGGLS